MSLLGKDESGSSEAVGQFREVKAVQERRNSFFMRGL
jgi:hypothetical protein